MNRRQLEHVIDEIERRFGLEIVYVVGSSAVFASIPDLPPDALPSTRDVDLAVPPGAAFDANHVDFVLGEGSDFDAEYGYYVQGVGLETPTFAPEGWTERAVEIRRGRTLAKCIELHDLALSKYGAGRDKDLEFTRSLVSRKLLDRDLLLRRLESVATTPELRRTIAGRIDRDFREG